MKPVQHRARFAPVQVQHNYTTEIIARVVLYLLYRACDFFIAPREQMIFPEELWMYKNPRIDDYVPDYIFWPITILLSSCVFGYIYFLTKSSAELIRSTLGLTLCVYLTLFLCIVMKIVIGRPRPDFYWRCNPKGGYYQDSKCTGCPLEIAEGRKSFPSGHSAVSFTVCTYLSMYLASKWHVCCSCCKSNTTKFLCCFGLLFVALMISLSRVVDHHHHPSDVLAGMFLGVSLAYVSYRQYYPSSPETSCLTPEATVPLARKIKVPVCEDPNITEAVLDRPNTIVLAPIRINAYTQTSQDIRSRTKNAMTQTPIVEIPPSQATQKTQTDVNNSPTIQKKPATQFVLPAKPKG